MDYAGADPGFQVRGGALKKIAMFIMCKRRRKYRALYSKL
jgi:hypothetical protein